MSDRQNSISIRDYVLRVAATTLSGVILAVVVCLLIGLYDPVVDNNKIFEILGPAFQTVIGAFVGVIGTLALEHKEIADDKEASKLPPPADNAIPPTGTPTGAIPH